MRPDYARAAYSYTNRAVLGFSMLFFQVWKIKIRAGFFPYQILNVPCYREKKKYRTLILWIRDTSKNLALKILIRYTQKIVFLVSWHDRTISIVNVSGWMQKRDAKIFPLKSYFSQVYSSAQYYLYRKLWGLKKEEEVEDKKTLRCSGLILFKR
jgi:hypothetical protein